jgi:hypothetical protein
MEKTNEMKFSSYGVWDLIRKVYQNKEELLPRMGFKEFDQFLDWMKTGDQDTQDEMEKIVTKYEMEKSSPMTESKLKLTIKEEIKRILSKDTKHKKDLSENVDHNKNSMIRGMMSMLKDPEIKNASFEDLMNLNIAMQQLMPDIKRPDYDSPSNTAAIKAMIDMDKEKGRRPSLDEDENKTDEVVDDVKDEMSSILKALDNELEKQTKTQNEGLLTVAGIALALPAIMGLVAKFGKAAGNIVRKVLGKKPTDEGEYQEWMAKLGGIADDLHHLYMAPIKGIVSKFIKDKAKSDKVSNAIFHVIVATFLVISGATAVKALQSKNLSLTTLESALTAVKGGEVKAFISSIAG